MSQSTLLKVSQYQYIGAPEAILPRCSSYMHELSISPMTDIKRKEIDVAINSLMK